jgi:hypothetical protein
MPQKTGRNGTGRNGSPISPFIPIPSLSRPYPVPIPTPYPDPIPTLSRPYPDPIPSLSRPFPPVHRLTAFTIFCVSSSIHILLISHFKISSSDNANQRGRTSLKTKRLHNESTAVKNIVIITLAYVLCFVPGIIFTAFIKDIDHSNHWRNFFIPLSIFFSNTVDPVVFISRSRSLRRGLKNIVRNLSSSNDVEVLKSNHFALENSFRSHMPQSLLTTHRPESYVTTSQLNVRLFHKTAFSRKLRSGSCSV